MTDNWLERTELLLGAEKLEKLRAAHVLVVGLGGVGAYAAEMIVRAGVGRMTVADADTVNPTNIKLALILGALKRGIPLVSSMGAGAKTDPTRLEIEDISRTHHCPLAHMLRKRLHKAGVRSGFKAVFSAEPVREGATILCEEQNKKSNTGTISYLPALFGIGCASVVVRGVIGEL